MTKKMSVAPSRETDNAVPVIGETGKTVVYIFPDGNARVKKGKKSGESSQDDCETSSQESSTTTSNVEAESQATSLEISQQISALDSVSISASASTSTAAPPPDSLSQQLIQAGLITQIQLDVAMYDLALSDMSLVDVLLARGWVTEEAIATLLVEAS